MAAIRTTLDNNDNTIIKFMDEKIFDPTRIKQIGRELIEEIEKAPEGRNVIIDFANIEFMESMMIGELIAANKEAKRGGQTLKFADLQPGISEAFENIRFSTLFDIRPNQTAEEVSAELAEESAKGQPNSGGVSDPEIGPNTKLSPNRC